MPAPDRQSVVYLLWCHKDNSLYTGWTNDLPKRLRAHQSGRGSSYTRSRLPVDLAAVFAMSSPTAARKEEARIKRLTRAQKLSLIEEAAQPPRRTRSQ
jgi:putative endonuclease